MVKTKPKKEVKIVKKKIIPRMSDEQFNAKKIHDLLKMFESYSENKLTFWEDNSGKGDIMGIVPVTRDTRKIIGGMFNPYEVKKEEKFVHFYVIDIINSLKSNIIDDICEKKRNFIEERGMIYLRGFNINQIFESVINNQ